MSNSIDEALLVQQIEFLKLELEEAKKREEGMKRQNESVMQAVSSLDSKFLQDETISELQKSNDQLEQELGQTKQKLSKLQEQSESKIKELELSNKELSLSLKQATLNAGTSDQELLFTIKSLENEKERLLNLTKNSEAEKEHALQVNDFKWQTQVKQLTDEIEKLKQKHLEEIEALQNEQGNAIAELNSLFNKEKERLKDTIRQLTERCSLLTSQVDEHSELDRYYDEGDSELSPSERKMVGLERALNEKNKMIEDYEQEFTQFRASFNVSNGRTRINRGLLCDHCDSATSNHLHSRLTEAEDLNRIKDKIIEKLNIELESLKVEKKRADVEKTKILLELKQHKLDHKNIVKVETEADLKGDIKALVGSLMNAKQVISNNSFNRSSTIRPYRTRESIID